MKPHTYYSETSMPTTKSVTDYKPYTGRLSRSLLTAAMLLSTLGARRAFSAPDTASGTTNQTLTIKGTDTFRGKASSWSATLTPKGKDTYEAVYISTWGGKPLSYTGTIETDGKTKITGAGKNANGSFEFSGTYGKDNIAQCSYKEVGGTLNRSGTMTAEAPKSGSDKEVAVAPATPAKP